MTCRKSINSILVLKGGWATPARLLSLFVRFLVREKEPSPVGTVVWCKSCLLRRQGIVDLFENLCNTRVGSENLTPRNPYGIRFDSIPPPMNHYRVRRAPVISVASGMGWDGMTWLDVSMEDIEELDGRTGFASFGTTIKWFRSRTYSTVRRCALNVEEYVLLRCQCIPFRNLDQV
jgi:hypothetical protein